MQMDAQEIDDVKAFIVIARKREINFGLCLAKSPEDTGLLFHRIKPPETLLRKVKRLDGVIPAKSALGTARAKGRKLMLTCAHEPPPGAARRLRRFLQGVDMPMKVILLDASGTLVEEDGEDDEDEILAERAGPGAAAPTADVFEALGKAREGWTPEDGIDKATGKWRKARRLVGPKILAYAQGPTPDATGIGQSWERALALGDTAGDPVGAYRMLTRIVERIKAAAPVVASDASGSDEDAMKAFKAFARRIRRRIELDGSPVLRTALIDAVGLAKAGDPSAGLRRLEDAAAQERAEG